MERSVLENLTLMLILAPVMVASWYYLNVYLSKKLGRKTKDDLEACIKEHVLGPALIRFGIHLSTAILVYGAFTRWV